jgi:acyl carrier protein
MIVDATLDQVCRIAADVLDVPIERLTPDSAPESVESWDSIHHLSLALALEEHFDVIFTPEEIEQMVNLGALARVVRDKLA